MEKKSSGSSGGIGFWGALQIVFIVLKLTGNISWPWWLVLSPAWISVCLAVILIVIVAILESIE